jgi:hypothetical protein
MSAHVGNMDEGGSHSCTLLGDLGQLLLGRPKALVVFLKNSMKFQYLGLSLRT